MNIRVGDIVQVLPESEYVGGLITDISIVREIVDPRINYGRELRVECPTYCKGSTWNVAAKHIKVIKRYRAINKVGGELMDSENNRKIGESK